MKPHSQQFALPVSHHLGLVDDEVPDSLRIAALQYLLLGAEPAQTILSSYHTRVFLTLTLAKSCLRLPLTKLKTTP
jgi:hypothetical protein